MRFNRSEPGVIVSSVAHAALFALAFIGFSSAKPFSDQEEAVPVEVVSESDLRQMTRGDRNGKPMDQSSQKADRVAETNERKQDAQLAQRDVEAPGAPPPQEKKADPDAELRAKVEAEVKAKADAEAKARAAEQAERQRQAAAAAAAADKARQAAEAKARQDAAQKAEEEKERKDAEELRLRRAQEEKQAAETKARKEAEARALREKIEREQREEEERKQVEAEKAKKAAEARRAAEAKKAAEEKAKREAEAKAAAAKQVAEQKPYNPTDIEKILQNKQQAQSTGSTGPQLQRQASLGTPTSSAPKLSPSDKESLIGYLQAKMRECVSVPPGANRNAKPEIRVILARDGALAAPPALVGGDRAIGEAAVRGIRACAPYRIPDRFAAQYDQWRDLVITIDASDLN
ncbi:cell envelope integrity protein TolA [Terrarubrum flagellatum]|uniref:cell envelope integrity protein TolA n=1 Tax=Terrirubrum flagellatum TaxID=2895980 RepID=UPI003145455B